MEAEPFNIELLSLDTFDVFMQQYSMTIPFQTLWRVIGRNKQLLHKFNELSTNNWWRKKTKRDFYDFYDACLEFSTHSVKEFYLNWMRENITIHPNLWSKPWKLIYMVCYGTYTMILQNKDTIPMDEIHKIENHLSSRRVFGSISADMCIIAEKETTEVYSWITGELITRAEIESGSRDMRGRVYGAKNVVIFGNNYIYRRDRNIYSPIDDFPFSDPQKSPISNLIVNGNTELSFRSKIINTQDLASPTIVDNRKKKIKLIGLNYYSIDDEIFEWPTKYVDTVLTRGDTLQQVLGPYNFLPAKFSYILTKPTGGRILSYDGEDIPFSTTTTEQRFSYGFILPKYTMPKTMFICLPNGKTLDIERNTFEDQIVSVCGPFICFWDDDAKMWFGDLWTTLQKRRTSPMEFISSQHCSSCGLIASIECNSCNQAFCGENCALQVTTCAHTMEK